MYEVAELLKSKTISSVELTESAIQQADRWGPELNTFILQTPDLALKQAREADAEIANGLYRSSLHGVPIVLKDLFDTAGIATTAGSKVMAGRVPDEDAEVVRLLRDAGAVSMGKTGTPEFAAMPTSTNPHYGAVRNPWNFKYDTAGSSSGTAAAIASGMAWCGPGSDTGGSIRMPAAACGLVGLKPTWGRVSLRGVVPLNASEDHVGPMARTVRDAALLMQVLAGYDQHDIFSRDQPVGDYVSGLEKGVAGLRIAVIPSDGLEVDSEIAAAFDRCVEQLSQDCEVEEVDITGYWKNEDDDSPSFLAEIYAHHGHYLLEQPGDLSDYVLRDLILGQQVSGAVVKLARHETDYRMHQIERTLRPFDLAVSPTLAVFPPEVGARDLDLLRMTNIWDTNGWPAVSVPVGLSSENLPIGFQVIGKPWQEALVLQAARFIEQSHGLSYPPAGLSKQ